VSIFTRSPGAKAKVMTPTEAHAETRRIAGEQETLRARRANLAERLDSARGRVGTLARDVSAAMLDDVDPKALTTMRRERLAAAQEVEELELALQAADGRITVLGAELSQAERRKVAVAVLAALDRAGEIAARVDAAWGPVRDELVRLIEASNDVAAALKAAHPGTFSTFEISRAQLTHVLLWRVQDLLTLPPSFGERCTSAVELVSFTQIRAKLEAELADQEGVNA